MKLALALVAFVLWAHPSLVGLPLAALLIISPPPEDRSGWWSLPLAGLIGAASLTFLFVLDVPGYGSRLAAVSNAYIVLVTAAFVGGVILAPAPLLRQASRAILVAWLATAALIQLIWSSDGWDALAWEATREAGFLLRFIAGAPGAFGAYEPVVRLASLTWPAILALQALAGIALAWHVHRRMMSPAQAGLPMHDTDTGAPQERAPVQHN